MRFLKNFFGKWQESRESLLQIKAVRERINSLPFEEAKTRAEALLEDTNQFICKANTRTAQPEALGYLALSLQDLFSKYESIEKVDGTVEFNLDEIFWVDGKYIKIVGFSDFSEAAVLPHDERILDLGDLEISEDVGFKHASPSIYHYLIFLCSED